MRSTGEVFWSTYEVGSIHDAILHWVSAVQGEFQDLLLLLPTLLLDHLLLQTQTHHVTVKIARRRPKIRWKQINPVWTGVYFTFITRRPSVKHTNFLTIA